MRQIFRFFMAGLCALLVGTAAQAQNVLPVKGKLKVAEPATCGDYGTTVQFEKTPSDAARKALKEEKLVCVLHISGHFENSDFT